MHVANTIKNLFTLFIRLFLKLHLSDSNEFTRSILFFVCVLDFDCIQGFLVLQ